MQPEGALLGRGPVDDDQVVAWWIRHALTAARPRGSGAGSLRDDVLRANTIARPVTSGTRRW